MVLPLSRPSRSIVNSSDSNTSITSSTSTRTLHGNPGITSSKVVAAAAEEEEMVLMGAEYPAEYHKTFLVVLFLAIGGISNFAVLAYIHDITVKPPLPDIVHSFIPQQSWGLRVGDFMCSICACSAITLLIFHKHRHILIRRALFIVGILYFLRALSMLLTQLSPGFYDAEDRCRRQLDASERTWKVYVGRMMEQTLHIGFQDMEDKMLCGDLFFSGHTFIMVVSYLVVSYHLPEDKKFIRYFPGVAACIGTTSMVLCRAHYTIDVLFAYFLSVFMFNVYYSFCEIEEYGDRRKSILSQFFFIKVAMWLEEKVVPGKVENVYILPFASLIQKIRVKSRRQRQIDFNSNNISPMAMNNDNTV